MLDLLKAGILHASCFENLVRGCSAFAYRLCMSLSRMKPGWNAYLESRVLLLG
jgi:hypothetical protein